MLTNAHSSLFSIRSLVSHYFFVIIPYIFSDRLKKTKREKKRGNFMRALQMGLIFRLYTFQVHHWVSDTTVLKVLPLILIKKKYNKKKKNTFM